MKLSFVSVKRATIKSIQCRVLHQFRSRSKRAIVSTWRRALQLQCEHKLRDEFNQNKRKRSEYLMLAHRNNTRLTGLMNSVDRISVLTFRISMSMSMCLASFANCYVLLRDTINLHESSRSQTEQLGFKGICFSLLLPLLSLFVRICPTWHGFCSK